MTSALRLTLAQALVRHLAALRIELDDGSVVPYCAGVWAIFGHGNVAGLGEALAAQRDAVAPLPVYQRAIRLPQRWARARRCSPALVG